MFDEMKWEMMVIVFSLVVIIITNINRKKMNHQKMV